MKSKYKGVIPRPIGSQKLPITVKLDENVGIYAIVNDDIKSAYIGQSVNVPKRLSQHKSALKNGVYALKGNKMKYLSDDVHRFGITSFRFEQILVCDPDELIEWETYCCKLYSDDGYNLYNQFMNTEITGLFCPEAFKPVIEKLIDMLDKGRIKIEQLEQAIWTIENQ